MSIRAWVTSVHQSRLETRQCILSLGMASAETSCKSQNAYPLCPAGMCCAATWPRKFQEALVFRGGCSSSHSTGCPHPPIQLCRGMLCHHDALDAPAGAAVRGEVVDICCQMNSYVHIPPCRCTLCHRDALDAAREPQFEGRLRQGLGCLVCVRVTATQNTWVHEQCAFWSPEVGARVTLRARQLHACSHAGSYGLGPLVALCGG